MLSPTEFEVTSQSHEDKTYMVVYHGRTVRCSCPSWTYSGQQCKHMAACWLVLRNPDIDRVADHDEDDGDDEDQQQEYQDEEEEEFLPLDELENEEVQDKLPEEGGDDLPTLEDQDAPSILPIQPTPPMQPATSQGPQLLPSAGHILRLTRISSRAINGSQASDTATRGTPNARSTRIITRTRPPPTQEYESETKAQPAPQPPQQNSKKRKALPPPPPTIDKIQPFPTHLTEEEQAEPLQPQRKRGRSKKKHKWPLPHGK
eukprot:GEZU01027616.1.p1 GENE.GEZU01027616.1~~GEZU01027616.1.p1  ORF type:complete len:260 (-),score=57.40 GEZU01027616.1:86-865(-)